MSMVYRQVSFNIPIDFGIKTASHYFPLRNIAVSALRLTHKYRFEILGTTEIRFLSFDCT
jgi:hypothetical protein